MSETVKSRETITVIVCLAILAIGAMIAVTLYNINDRNNMSKNIEAAITKGIDPLAVKCAYEVNPNAICITYAATTPKK